MAPDAPKSVTLGLLLFVGYESLTQSFLDCG
jgi:hypothetical protein